VYDAGMAVVDGGETAADEAGGGHTRPTARSAGPAVAALLLLAVATSVGALLITARHGPGITPDSVTYLAAAVSLRDGAGLNGPDGEPYAAFPPLFPALLAPAAGGRESAVDAARGVNAAGYGVTVFLIGLLVLRLTGSGTYGTLAGAAVAVSRPVLDGALHVWSEPLFIASSMAALVLAVEGMQRRWAPGIVAAGALAGLAAVMRYAGLALAPVVVVAALAAGRRGRPPLLLGVVVAVAAVLPPAIWIARNLAVSGTAAGERYPAAESLRNVAYDAALALSRWAAPLALGDRLRLLVMVAVGGTLAAGAWWAARRTAAAWLRPAALIAGAVAVALLYLSAAATLTALDPIDERLISPLVPPLVALAFIVLAAVVREGRRSLGPRAPAIGLLVAALWVALLARDSSALVRRIEEQGIGGYEAARWRESPLLAALRRTAPDGAMYSNDPFAIWYWTGREASLSPRRYPYRSPQSRVDDLAGLREVVAAGEPVYLVWFDGVPRDFLLSVDDLRATLEIEPVLRAPDGAVYRMSEVRE
jgi:hypothetical protein